MREVELENIKEFIVALKKGRVGTCGLSIKLTQLVENFHWFQERIGTENTWLEIYGELAEILEFILNNKEVLGLMLNMPTNDYLLIKGKMNDDGTYNPQYKLT